MLLGNYAVGTGVHAVGMDTSVDPVLAKSTVPGNIALQGNLDPLAVVAGGSAMVAQSLSILQAMRGRPFIFNLGHGIVPHTPVGNVAALTELVRAA
jgi:uroporphyrinogen decarboxylase